MTILDRDVLFGGSQCIWFIELPASYKPTDWNNPTATTDPQARRFFDLHENLLEIYCSVTGNWSPIDPHQDVLLDTPTKIYSLAAELSLWAMQLCRSIEHPFFRQLEWMETVDLYRDLDRPYSQLKHDLIETLLFLVGQLNNIAARNGQLFISSI